jgi:hypothetical protein
VIEDCAVLYITAMYMLRRGQVKRLDGRDAARQAKFVESLFGSPHTGSQG